MLERVPSGCSPIPVAVVACPSSRHFSTRGEAVKASRAYVQATFDTRGVVANTVEQFKAKQ